jgi:hypothetical protein
VWNLREEYLSSLCSNIFWDSNSMVQNPGCLLSTTVTSSETTLFFQRRASRQLPRAESSIVAL